MAYLKQVLIYISYDTYEYVNYFNMVVDDEFVIEYLPVEKSDELFDVLDKMNICDSDMELLIVADENASYWNYQKEFEKRKRNLPAGIKEFPSNICKILENNFGTKYYIGNPLSGRNYGEIKIQILYPSNCHISSGDESNCETEEILDKARQIMEKDKDGMSELARIIIEKHERMSKHE